MSTFEEVTDPLIGTYLPVPPLADGVCGMCHAIPSPGFTRCYSCAVTSGQVSRPVHLVVPITMYELGGQLWHTLRYYKDSPYPGVRHNLSIQVAALFGRFIRNHAACIVFTAGDPWDCIVVPPSSRNRNGRHPLVQALELIDELPVPIAEPLIRSDFALDHRTANDNGYQAMEDVTGLRILLVDDTWTSGARMQSAASALQSAGADVVAAVVIGRVLYPDFNEVNRRQVEELRRKRFSFEVCCLDT